MPATWLASMTEGTGLPIATPSGGVLITEELACRPARAPDHAAENRVLLELAAAMASSPNILDALVQAVAELCQVRCAGIGLIEGEGADRLFRCHAVTGPFTPWLGKAAPYGESPSAYAVERNAPQLLEQPSRAYPHIAELGAIEELLVVPLYRGTVAIGSLWIIAAPGERRFDAEDARLLTSVARFAAAAIALKSSSAEATRAAGELRDLQARLQSTLAASAIATWEWNVAQRTVFADASLRHMFGLADEQPGGIPLEDFNAAVHPDDRAAVRTAVEQALSGERPYEVEYRVRDRDGRTRWIVARGQVERAADGTPLRFPGAAIDITARKAAQDEAARLAAETALATAKFRAVFEQSPFYAGIMTLDGTFVDVSRTAVELCGYTREQVLGIPFWQTPWWRGSAEVQAQIRAATAQAAAGESFAGQLPYWFADGSEHVTDFHLTPVRDERGEVIFLFPTGLDITDRIRSEQALRRSEFRLETELLAMTRLHHLSERLIAATDLRTVLHEILSAAMELLSADKGNVQVYNPAVGGLEIAVQEGFERPFLEHFRVVRAEDESACGQAVRAGERVVVGDIEQDPSYASLRHVAVQAGYRAVQSTPLLSRSGELLGMLSTHFSRPHTPSEVDLRTLDLYARQAADILERARFQETLAEADKRKTEFLATLAHELRNPLAPIVNASQILRRAGADSAVAESSRAVIDRQVQQLVRLVDDLLDLSRISTGKLELRPQRCELADIVQAAVETSRPIIEASDHRLSVELPSEPIVLHGDETRLAQVLLNLLNNAAKYTPHGGHIRIGAERQGDSVVIRVRDTGSGIEPQMLSRIFDLFAQVTDSLGSAQGGLGIGLTLARRLVEMHGGRIEASSDGPNRGSEFSVHLPLGDAPAARESAVESPSEASIAGRRILVVDDNQDSAESMSLLLSLLGNEVRTAYDGVQALNEADAFRPDLVLLDIGLPGLNGYEVAERLRSDPVLGRATLVALTGWAQDDDRRRSREAGFDHHLVKPTELSDLQRILAETRPV
jgi:PAS domain S-box-containing protein